MDVGKFFTDEDVVADMVFGDGDNTATITIRFVSSEQMNAILKKCTRVLIGAKNQWEEKVNNREFKRLVGEAAVVGWSGIAAGGVEVPFTASNRDKAMIGWGKFSNFVLQSCDDLQALVAAEQERARGN